ncbi:DNA-binding SARP family transcriptional activator/tetratricopeptide (TPR) repeat protein [Kitasatospora sp. MAA19]|uniref:AfsR/SARP family transcriptional regulator n=1 Tax=Kitasatospora sp. MAA19 TaxID=3035090 RepID=UPI0024742AE2|nr:BTAD domain-containing putative transcriptional regulator [Kitasatospora sp. MAA19]MDH6705252.1 DNA-binding SARP family transcriptional activator/tetratricopeptide (TPR) repeat protein [Kitasatospora sp. MAA19]
MRLAGPSGRVGRPPKLKHRGGPPSALSRDQHHRPSGDFMEFRETPQAPALRFQVLGPVQAWLDGKPLSLGSPQQQAVLTTLLLQSGRPVTTQDLVDALWGDRPPTQAVAALRTYVSRLRSVIEPRREIRGPSEVLVSIADGYALRIPNDALDLTVFEKLSVDAAAARASGDQHEAHRLLAQALQLFSGRPLTGIPGPYADAQRLRLAERQVAAVEESCAAALDIGLHAEIVSDLNILTAEHPLRERLRELLMLALYRCGRQAEALGVYTDTRKLLIEELGVEPGASLSAMHARILAADPALTLPEVTASAAARRDGPAAPPAPAQLPADVSDFSGRSKLVADLSTILQNATGQAVVVTSLAGIGGVGKTTLAVHVAHRVRSEFPDGQLYVDLRGAGASPADPVVVLGDFLHSLGVTESPDSLEQRAALYRSQLAGRRMLILLDNARDAEQIKPLIPGVSGCAVLATSRSRLAGIPGAQLFDVEELTPAEAMSLFSAIVGEQRAAAEPEATMAVVKACGFLPLAVRIAAARLASRPRWSVSDLARRLADQRRRLDELQLGNLAVETTIGLGYGQLSAAEARAFRLLSLIDSTDIPLEAAAALLDLNEDAAEDLAEALVEANMLECFTPGRYRYHDLLRLYAQRQNERIGDAEERERAIQRLFDLLIPTMRNAAQAIEPDDTLPELLTTPALPGIGLPTSQSAQDWLRTEGALLLSAVETAANGPDALQRSAVDLLNLMFSIDPDPTRGPRGCRVLETISQDAERRGDSAVLARAYFALGTLQSVTSDFQGAEHSLRRSLDHQAPDNPSILLLATANTLGWILGIGNSKTEALGFLEQARATSQAVRTPTAEARIVGNMARVQHWLGMTETAIQSASDGVSAARESKNGPLLAQTLYQLGVVLTGGEAVPHLREAHQLYRSQRNRLWEGYTLARLASALLAAGQQGEAAEAAGASLAIAQEMDSAYCQGLANAALGEALLALAQPARGLACLQEAHAIFTRLGVPEASPVANLISQQHTEPPPSSPPAP